MSAQASRAAERGYHQDYIARIRYENTLPPPPGAPKLLNIPTEGLNYYTSAAFASRMARQQPLNIEADAELGMPIDLVGMPGIFDGDESSIQAPLAIPPIHPKDKNLLRPISELGKPKFSAAGHSFLRRTEYISSEAKARAEANANAAKTSAKHKIPLKSRKQVDASKEDPMNILRHVVKGFDLVNPEDAYTGPDSTSNIRGAVPTSAESEAWKRPKHPTRTDLKLLDTYSIKPDLDALTDSGAYMITKFTGNPTTITHTHDIRMDVGIIHPVEQPSGDYSYEFYLPKDVEVAKNIKRKFDVTDPGRDDPALCANVNTNGVPTVRYDHHRTYDIGRQANAMDQLYKEVALALHDPELDKQRADAHQNGQGTASDRLEKAAYYYPIGTKMQLRPRRNKNLVQLGLASQKLEESAEKPDAWDLAIRDPDEDELEQRAAHRAELEPMQEVRNDV